MSQFNYQSLRHWQNKLAGQPLNEVPNGDADIFEKLYNEYLNFQS